MQCYGVTQSFIWLFVGAVVCVVGGILYIYMPSIVDDIMTLELALSSSSIIYPVWQEIPVPIYRSFYLFNYTNAAEFNADPNNVTPNVTECGPFVYRELRDKVFISWNSDGEYVQYRETHTYPFQPDLSNGWEEDQTIWTPNLPLATIINMFNGYFKENARSSLPFLTLPTSIFHMDIIIPIPANEIIWIGYHNPIIDIAQQTLLQEEIIPGGMFALFYGKNATDDCEYEINRGTKDISQEFEIRQWNKNETLPYWGGEYCNMINGSDGTMYNSKITPDDTVYIFISDICRSIYLNYLDDRTYRDYKGHLFTSGELLFADPGTNPSNECFCNTHDGGCYATGFSNIGPCKFDAPIFLSHPHYLWVDEDVRKTIDGLSPDEAKHRSEVNIEPNSGMLLWINIRFQISMRLDPLKRLFSPMPGFDVPDYHNLPTIMLPVIWLDENAVLDDARISMLKHDLFIPMNVAHAVPIVIMALGGAAALIGISCMISLLWTQKQKEDKIQKEIEESYNEEY